MTRDDNVYFIQKTTYKTWKLNFRRISRHCKTVASISKYSKEFFKILVEIEIPSPKKSLKHSERFPKNFKEYQWLNLPEYLMRNL